jgi:hypothetical protein
MPRLGCSEWLIKSRNVWIGHWINWTHCLQYLITIHNGAIAVCTSINVHWGLSVFCQFTSPLAPPSNVRRSLLLVFKLSPRHSRSDSRLSVKSPSSGTAYLVQICSVWSFPTDWLLLRSQSQSHVTTDSQSVLVSDAHVGPATNFSFSLRFYLDSCGFVIL